jgi:serine/threonine protein kinase
MEEFVKESEQLRRFGGRHPNIVTLLASIDDGSRSLSLLFPWAEGDLLHFWTRRVKPSHDLQIFTWTANQFYRIVEAINFIHDPPGEVDSLGKSLFGRHGDIKPENILWYTRGIEDTLVISDLGLTAVHRETSRSMVDAMNISTTLSYRPPECDIASIVKGKIGFISRSFDIWGLGCVFLEHMVWTLRGCEGMTAFDENRCSPYLDGLYTETNEYFGVVRVAAETSPQHYAFKIKDQVVEVSWILFD